MEDDFDQFIESYLNERQRYADYRDIANFDLTIAGGATTVIDIKFQISDDDDWICGEMQLINEKHPSRIFTYNSSLRPNLPVDVNKFFRYYNQCVQILREKQDRTPEQTWFLDYISS